jgi:hypothetical protein
MVNILSLFDKEQLAKFKQDSKGNLKGPCPSCGYSQSNYGGFVINLKYNNCHCYASGTNFDFLETIALIKGIISCGEGRQSK